MSAIPFSNFTKGEISPELQSRLDTTQYSAAAKQVRNFIIQRYGGLSFRPGFRLVGELDNVTDQNRLVTFQYNIEQAYVLAFGKGQFRLLTAGGFIVEQDLQITAITQEGTPLVTAAYHGLSVGDRVFFSGIIGMTQLNGRTAKVLAISDANNFVIDINTYEFSPFISSTGTVLTAPPTPPVVPTPAPAPTPTPASPTITTGGGTGYDTGRGSYYFYRQGAIP